MKNICLILFSVFMNNAFSQVQQFDFEPRLDELKGYFPNSCVKNIDLELAYFTALSFYSEFKNVKIVIRYADIETSMQCRPEFESFFSSKRKYIIKVNSDRNSPIYPLKANFSALVGCFGHELAHIVRYEKQSTRQIIYDGIKFISNQNFRSKYEKDTDIIAAKMGLGYEQYEYAKFIFENPKLSKDYLEFKNQVYHNPEELLEIHREYGSEQCIKRQ